MDKTSCAYSRIGHTKLPGGPEARMVNGGGRECYYSFIKEYSSFIFFYLPLSRDIKVNIPHPNVNLLQD